MSGTGRRLWCACQRTYVVSIVNESLHVCRYYHPHKAGRRGAVVAFTGLEMLNAVTNIHSRLKPLRDKLQCQGRSSLKFGHILCSQIINHTQHPLSTWRARQVVSTKYKSCF